MPLKTEHFHIAKLINEQADRIIRQGKSNVELLGEMQPYMNGYKNLLDNAGPNEMNMLCSQYAGLYEFTSLLETIAKDIQSGEIDMNDYPV